MRKSISTYESILAGLDTPVRPWCKSCPHFKEFITNAAHYQLSQEDIAASALRLCRKPPKTATEVQPEVYWQTQVPNCEIGLAKLELDAQQAAARYGYKLP